MTQREPKVDFASLTFAEIGAFGLLAARRAFAGSVDDGLTNGDSLIATLGIVDQGYYHELAADGFGPDADDFCAYIDEETGKLATAIEFQMDSIDAVYEFGDQVPQGAQRFTGGVAYRARVLTRDLGWREQRFAGAGSGVQGPFDADAISAGVRRMAACWSEQMKARYGDPRKPA